MDKKKKKNVNPDKEKKNIFPVNFSHNIPIMEILGNREVNIEGLNGVLEYDESIIRLNTGNMIISFHGRGLDISCLTASSLTIKGYINKIEFLR